MSKSPHHVHNIRDFIQQFKDIKLKIDCISSYHVKAIFTSMPTEPANIIIKKQLEHDSDLHQRTFMIVDSIISLLEFCLKKTHFLFKVRCYEPLEGADMGSPISLIVANLFMEIWS